jgi:hypothetical protein
MSTLLFDDDGSADTHEAVKLPDVLVVHADAAMRHKAAD